MKIVNKYYEKDEEQVRKEARETYQNFSKEEKEET